MSAETIMDICSGKSVSLWQLRILTEMYLDMILWADDMLEIKLPQVYISQRCPKTLSYDKYPNVSRPYHPCIQYGSHSV